MCQANLKYLPHPNPYYVQWLSDSGEMKVTHMVRVNFEIGPYKDSIDFSVLLLKVCFFFFFMCVFYNFSIFFWVGVVYITPMANKMAEPIHIIWSSRARKLISIL